MTVAIAVLLVLILIAAALLAWRLSRPSVLGSALRERVIVTLKTGEGYDGLLFRVDGKTWELVQAAALGVGERGADVPVNGTLLIPADNVAYAQRP